MTYHEAAIRVLKEAGKPLHYREITQLAIERGYIESRGWTPENTMNYTLNLDKRKGVTDGPFVAYGKGIYGLRDSSPPPNGLGQLAKECCVPVEFLKDLLTQLERRKQVILYGPPGTGKTYVARKLAEHLTDGNRERWMLIQFHPSYTYEDFMEGIRPQSVRGTDGRCDVSYPVVAGSFKQFCERAAGDREHTYVFIIDEFNRGQIAKIFGELMYLLEYRGKSIRLAYTKSAPRQTAGSSRRREVARGREGGSDGRKQRREARLPQQ